MLKKTQVILYIFFLTAVAYSQRIKWEETFPDKNIETRGWKLVNNDKGGADIELYSPVEFFGLGVQSPHAGSYFFKLSFINMNRFNMIDDWIISPRIYDIHEGDSISFWCGAIDREFKDSLKVWISTSNDSLSSFTMIDYFKVSGPVGSWHKKGYDLSAYAGKNIYFAVNYYIKDAGAFGRNSDVVWIDHFTHTGKGFGGIVPTKYELFQNFPNPFNPQTEISFGLPEDSRVTLKIYNLLGEQVTQLVNADYKKGIYSVVFDGANYASGVYFYRLTAGSFTDEKKMVLVK